MERLGVRTYIAGGSAVVSEKFENDLKKDSFNVKRLIGSNRYQTATKIVKEVSLQSNYMFLVNGGSEQSSRLADALAIEQYLEK